MGRRRTARWTVPLVVLLLAACGSSPDAPIAEPATTEPATTAVPTTPVPTTARPATTRATPVPTTVTVPRATTTAPVPVAGPAFIGTASTVTAADLPSSWRAGCPVGPDDLRKLQLSFWGFDDQPHTGALVVHASVAPAIIDVFHRLYDHRFPIRRMEPVDVYGGNDDASTAADNTTGFNCRDAVSSGPPSWSAHAFGKAIDVNPVENPYILNGTVLPPGSEPYVNRSNVRPGMAVRGGELLAAFAEAGWGWGGGWANPDYQHFSASGG